MRDVLCVCMNFFVAGYVAGLLLVDASNRTAAAFGLVALTLNIALAIMLLLRIQETMLEKRRP